MSDHVIVALIGLAVLLSALLALLVAQLIMPPLIRAFLRDERSCDR